MPESAAPASHTPAVSPHHGTATHHSATHRLGDVAPGYRGRILAVEALTLPGGFPAEELERRLVELGFVEGALVEVLHQGLFGRDPIAVRVDSITVALRRREAASVLATPVDAHAAGHEAGIRA